MKILTMKRKTLDGEPILVDSNSEYYENPKDWFCEIETKEEEMVYDDFVKHLGEYGGDCRDILWNKMVMHAGQGMGVKWGDDDMYGYIRPDEAEPEVGEEYKDADGDIWERVE